LCHIIFAKVRFIEDSIKFLKGKNKSDLVSNILKRVASSHNVSPAIFIAKNILKTDGFDDPAPMHDFYRQWFNLIDLGDNKWYKTADHHGFHAWKSKMLFSTMCHFMCNVYTLVASKNYETWINFRADLAKDLVNFWKED
jgi:hypothetical protein